MKNLPILIFVALLSFTACTPSNILFEEHKQLSPELEWKKEDARTFEVAVTDDSKAYDVKLAFRYATGFQFKNVKLNVIETTPSGETKTHAVTITVVNEKGDYIGEPGLDIWDSTHPFLNNVNFSQTGTYSYTIQHDMPQDPLQLAMEIGLIVEAVQ